jgi:2-polyprenyl-6-methoxyphenol hydroxylase-like FAD-dependent oxidoreductase
MLRSLDPQTIKWGHGLRSCRVIDKDTYEIIFIDSTIPPVRANILIGADGVFSQVRSIVHDSKPGYCGVTMYDLTIPAGNMTPELHDFVGPGSCFVLNEGLGLLPQMNSGGRCKVYASLQRPIEWIELNPLPEKGKREWLCDFYAGWCDGLAEKLIMAADEDTVVARRIYGFSVDLEWQTDLTGVTLMGESHFHVPVPVPPHRLSYG